MFSGSFQVQQTKNFLIQLKIFKNQWYLDLKIKANNFSVHMKILNQ